MAIRERFERKLGELREDILQMGSMVENQLHMALRALENLDTDLAAQINVADQAVNQARFSIEDKCFALIVTQQPAARDLRAIVAVMNMIVDLERMGDQAKGIGKVVTHMAQQPKAPFPPELRQMGTIVSHMLQQAMTAYANNSVDVARIVEEQDDQVDLLYAAIFKRVMSDMAGTKNPGKIEASYEVLRAARELERFGDLATNVAERVIYIATGELYEANVDRDDSVG